MAKRKRPAPKGAPDWIVTYGDMMSLLLCFFVILVSMSETKNDKRFQEVMESIRSAFGFDGSFGVMPVPTITKNSIVEQLQQVVLLEQIKKEGDAEEEGIEGRVFRVTNVREGINLEIGGKISFGRFSAELKPEAVPLVANLASMVSGHNTVIKVRGHASNEPLASGSSYKDSLDLSYARARAVAAALEANGILPRRIRVVACGDTEPLAAQAYDEERRALNRRVEVIVTEAIVDDYAGELISKEPRDDDYGP